MVDKGIPVEILTRGDSLQAQNTDCHKIQTNTDNHQIRNKHGAESDSKKKR